MNKARRAKPRRARLIVPIAIAAALVVGGSVAAVQLWPESDEVGAGLVAVSPSQTPTAAPEPESSATPLPVATPSPVANPSPSATVNEAVVTALTGCRAKVAEGDKIIGAAKKGVVNWNAHVQAQTDSFDGKISASKMNKIFARTRLAGPADQKRYANAKKAYDKADGSCAEVGGAASEVAKSLSQCQKRADAQKAVLKAGKAGMSDWSQHLRAMEQSRTEYVPGAREIWLKTWKAAPKNINAFESATKGYKPPKC